MASMRRPQTFETDSFDVAHAVVARVYWIDRGPPPELVWSELDEPAPPAQLAGTPERR